MEFNLGKEPNGRPRFYWSDWMQEIPFRGVNCYVKFHSQMHRSLFVYDEKGRFISEAVLWGWQDGELMPTIGAHKRVAKHLKRMKDRENEMKAELKSLKEQFPETENDMMTKFMRADVKKPKTPKFDPETGEILENVEFVEIPGIEAQKSKIPLQAKEQDKRQTETDNDLDSLLSNSKPSQPDIDQAWDAIDNDPRLDIKNNKYRRAGNE